MELTATTDRNALILGRNEKGNKLLLAEHPRIADTSNISEVAGVQLGMARRFCCRRPPLRTSCDTAIIAALSSPLPIKQEEQLRSSSLQRLATSEVPGNKPRITVTCGQFQGLISLQAYSSLIAIAYALRLDRWSQCPRRLRSHNLN